MTIEEIKSEILEAVPEDHKEVCEKELDIWSRTDNLDGKPILSKFYTQWKSGKKGDKNKVNSWTAYFLGVTSQKPEEGSEFFSKRRAFARPSPPDVDVDFDAFKKRQMFDYIYSKYGEEYVGAIAAYGSLQMKAALTRTSKALDLANAYHKGKDICRTENDHYSRAIIDALPKHEAILKGKRKVIENGKEIEKVEVVKTTKQAMELFPSFKSVIEDHDDVNFFNHVSLLEGLISDFKPHPAGIVISDEPISDVAPMRTAKSDGEKVFVTQYDLNDCESVGLVKFDVLAISTLSVVAKCIEMIKQRRNIVVPYKNLPIDQPEVYELYRKGHLTGVFQCESDGMQKTMKDIGVTNFKDIVAAIAMFRPGPMEFIPSYAARKAGKEKVDYGHPAIEKRAKVILEETYGIACIAGDQLVTLADGTEKPMKNIEKGDLVCCVDLDTKKSDIRPATGAIPTRVEKGVIVTLSNGYKVTCTKDHKIWTIDGWKEAGTLSNDDLVAEPVRKELNRSRQSSAGCNSGDLRFHKVTSVIETSEEIQFYGMGVDDLHNYIVGGILVKNCYQEQIMQVCRNLADFSADESYVLIKGVSKKKIDVIQKYHAKFIKGCGENGIPAPAAEDYWKNKILPFAGYGFNLAHACGYAYLSYTTAYLKALYPEEFFCSYFNVIKEFKKAKWHERVGLLEKAAIQMGISVRERNINTCGFNYEITKMQDESRGIAKSEITPSLFTLGLSEDAAHAIVESKRPFKTFQDFCRLTDPKRVKNTDLIALIDGGYMKCFKMKRQEMLDTFSLIREDVKKLKKVARPSMNLFSK